MKRKRAYLIGVGALGLVVAGVGTWASLSPREVDVVRPETREVVEVYVATGRVASSTVSDVGSELAGRVAKVFVDAGDRPERGKPLVDLQPLDARLGVEQAEARLAITEKELGRVRRGATAAQLEQARAELRAAEATWNQARKDLARAEAMARDGVGTAADLDRARSAVEGADARFSLAKARLDEVKSGARPEDIRVAQARVDEARANLDQTQAVLGKTTITSPFDGLVLSVDAAPGENVAPGQPLVRVAKTDDLEIYTEVDEDYFTRITPGVSATLVFPSMPDQRFRASVTQVGPEVDARRGVVAVHLEPESLPKLVVPGLTVDVALELQRLPDAVAVPRRAVIRDGDDAWVFGIEGGEATRLPVTIKAEGEAYIAIEGLKDEPVVKDATVVTEGEAVKALGGE